MFIRAVALIGLLIPVVAHAAEREQVEYAAIRTMEMSGAVMTGPISFTPMKQRDEIDMKGTRMITITRRDKGVAWQLMPDQKMYMETKLGAVSEDRPADLSGYTIETTEIGPEVVNGIATTKNKLIMTAKDGSKFGGFSWVTAEGITLKSDAIAMAKGSKERIRMELTDLVVGPQDPSNFEIPAGYSLMNMSNMMMQGMMGEETEDEPAEAGEPPPKKKWGLKGALDLLK